MAFRILTKRRTTGKVLRVLNDIFAPLRRVLELERDEDPYIDEALFKNKNNPLRCAQQLENDIHLICIPIIDDANESKKNLETALREVNTNINELDARKLYLKKPNVAHAEKLLSQTPALEEKITYLKKIHQHIKLAIEHFANQLKGANDILQEMLDNNSITAEGHSLPIIRDIAIGRKLPKPKRDKARGKLILGLNDTIKIDIFGDKSSPEALNSFEIAKKMVEDSMSECEKNINSHNTQTNQKDLKKLIKMLGTITDNLNIFNAQAALLIAKADQNNKVEKALAGLTSNTAPAA